jgi:hypothetical protein
MKDACRSRLPIFTVAAAQTRAYQIGVARGRLFGLDMGDWSVLVGGFALAGLLLFLTYPVGA